MWVQNKKYGTVGTETNFEIVWNAAIDTALANSYKRVVVDLYADWNAVAGVFGSDSGNGFDNAEEAVVEE